MKKRNLKQLVLSLALMLPMTASALDMPQMWSQPQEGGKYILVSYSKPSTFWTRTSWDGAYYLLDYSSADSKKHCFVAHQDTDGTWFFNSSDTTFIGVPASTDNLNGNLTAQAAWTVEATDTAGFYRLKAGDGQGNPNVVGRYLHLNSGGQYIVISEPTNGWYPDFYGGYATATDEATGETYRLTDDNGEAIPLSHESELWAFLDSANIESYAQKVQIYAAVTDTEENYLSETEYAAGWQGMIDALTEIYNKSDFSEDDYNAAMAIYNAKKALYKEIQNAYIVLGESTDATLTAAINTAKDEFNGKNDAESLTAAQEALIAAENGFSMGTGDITSLGTNMSFEDLSAQGGQTTTIVGNPPAGWNLYVAGNELTSIDQIKAAGITGWCGVNDDADNKDGSYAFGIWNSGMPEVEISQAVNNLATGSYKITAKVMVGANGNGSRRTTQRIFGNLNSTYFSGEADYDDSRLDKSEVYGFAGLAEPQTDRELQEMSVTAFVYNGTLRFGFRTNGDIAAANRTSANPNGGDGWFKLDDFHLQSLGYVEDDALAVYNHFYSLLADIASEPMQKSVSEEITALVNSSSVGSGSSADDIVNAITSLKNAYPKAKESLDLYASLAAAIDDAHNNQEEYGNYAGIDAYSDIVLEAEMMYEDMEAGEEEVNAMIQKLDEALNELKLSGVAVGIYVTNLIKNPSFEDLSAQNNTESAGTQPAPAGWTLTIDGEEGIPSSGWCAINGGDDISGYGATDDEGNVIAVQYVDGTHLWGIWNDKIPEVELSQTLTALPSGTYVLSANVMVEYNWAGNCLTTQRIFANNYVQMFGDEATHMINLPSDAQAAKALDEATPDAEVKHLNYAGYTCTSDDPYTHTLRPMSVKFGVGEEGTAKIGFRTNNVDIDGTARTSGIGWFKVDNFQLFYESEDIPAGYSGIKEINSLVEVDGQQIFNLGGQKVDNLQKGVNIVKTRMADGTTKTVKVIIK